MDSNSGEHGACFHGPIGVKSALGFELLSTRPLDVDGFFPIEFPAVGIGLRKRQEFHRNIAVRLRIPYDGINAQFEDGR